MLSASLSSLKSPKNDESVVSRYTCTRNVYLRVKTNSTESKEQIYTVANATTLFVRRDVDRKYTFTKIFLSESSQEHLFHHAVRQQVINFLYGESSTVLIYGTSNSGKTYTMYGTPESPGIIPHAIDLLFSIINCTLTPWYKLTDDNRVISLNEYERHLEIQNKEDTINQREYVRLSVDSLKSEDEELCSDECFSSVWISIGEVYNDNVYDLLILNDSEKRPLKVTTHKDGSTYVNGLRSVHVTTALEACQLLVSAQSRMSVASTPLNTASSRSHTFLTVKLLKYEKEGAPDEVQASTLTFWDIAASQRLKKDEETSTRLTESRSINNSLLVLGRCLKIVSDSHFSIGEHVTGPFRESKLTRILQKSLTGQEKISFIFTIDTTAESFPETLNVLNISTIARRLGRNTFPPIGRSSVELDETKSKVLTVKRKASKETQTEGSFVDYKELIEKNRQLMINLEALECSRFNGELEIRQQLADQYSTAIEELENSWKKRMQDVEDEGRDLLKWSVKQVETFYKERIDSLLCNKKRKRNDENADGLRSFYEELETENAMVTSKVVVLRELVDSLKASNQVLCTEKNKCNFELTLVRDKLKDFYDSMRIYFPELASKMQDNVSNVNRFVRELKRLFDEKTKNVELLEKDLSQARDDCVNMALRSMEIEKEFCNMKGALKDFENETAEKKDFICTLQHQLHLLKEELAKVDKCKINYNRSFCNDNFLYDDNVDDTELTMQARVDIKAEHFSNYSSKKVSLNSTDAGIDSYTCRSSDSGNVKEDSGIDFSSRSQRSISINDSKETCNSEKELEESVKVETDRKSENHDVMKVENSLEKCVEIEDQLSLFDLRYEEMKKSFAKCKIEDDSRTIALEKESSIKASEVTKTDRKETDKMESASEKSEEESSNYREEHLDVQSRLEMKLKRLSVEIRNRDDELISLRTNVKNDREAVEYLDANIVRSDESAKEKLACLTRENSGEAFKEEIRDSRLQLTTLLSQRRKVDKEEEVSKLKLQLFENEWETELVRKHRNDLIKKYECMVQQLRVEIGKKRERVMKLQKLLFSNVTRKSRRFSYGKREKFAPSRIQKPVKHGNRKLSSVDEKSSSSTSDGDTNSLAKTEESFPINVNLDLCQALDNFDVPCDSGIGLKSSRIRERISGWMKVRKSNAKMDLLH
ncbi:Kinesin-like protein KIF20B [Anthophora plagiata]